MDPEIRQIGPGVCPICGAFRPVMVTAEAQPELADMTRRFWFGLTLALPVFVLEMGSHITGTHLLPPQTSNWVQLMLATPVVLWAGWTRRHCTNTCAQASCRHSSHAGKSCKCRGSVAASVPTQRLSPQASAARNAQASWWVGKLRGLCCLV